MIDTKTMKERMVDALEVMGAQAIEKIYNAFIQENVLQEKSWDDIPTGEPDAIDLEMIEAAANDPDCNTFISSEELKKELGL